MSLRDRQRPTAGDLFRGYVVDRADELTESESDLKFTVIALCLVEPEVGQVDVLAAVDAARSDTFAGLTSRWMSPASCAASRALASWAEIPSARLARGPPGRSQRAGPRRRDIRMAMNRTPSILAGIKHRHDVGVI